ncbi:monoamine oxidase-like protein A [Corynespora cassiicola Philippines]|uniref:Amine oxidase n=1 Tax=Corynespora cassiicola Philippines TaxID=1448308 RepID=A0A2T2P4B8_CORCC|nr:monoamine oxidase-like protein A [Corynespora cassiicola Philippines]
MASFLNGRLWVKSCVQLLLSSSLAFSVYAATIPESVDVAIVGGGLSGLTAARDLLAAGKSVIILEARQRTGGKVYNKELQNGGVTEVGAEFVGPTQDEAIKLISELGLELFGVYNEGSPVLWHNNNRTVIPPSSLLGTALPFDPLSLTQLAAAQTQLNAWAAELNVSAPWSHPKAQEWDAISFEQWQIQQRLVPDARFMLESLALAIWAEQSRALSLLYVIAYIASAGNETEVGTLTRLYEIDNAAQQWRVVGGTGLIPQRLSERVGSEHISLNSPVKSITKQGAVYQVHSPAGTVQAKSVVLALGPTLVDRITFSPPLPDARQQLNKQMRLGAIGKGVPIYPTPFWREESLMGQAISDLNATKITFDSSPEDASFGAILGFLLGDDARRLDTQTPEQVQAAVISDIVRYFGENATGITEFALQRWDLEEHIWGGPTANAPPNVLAQYGSALRQSVDGIHFAGTETSEYWTGYMDGAIRAGQRVAKEIVGS